ncbi:MAG TPA: hypothetical protein VLW53_17185 [Candidatus Eisenbacteria bacterium]|nr:hypothetical protein [Candidatus Eisenbacteria bacterium]
MARALEEHSATLRAYRAFLTAALAYARYLRARGRLVDSESEFDIAQLEAMLRRVAEGPEGAGAVDGPLLRLPHRPADFLGHAARGQLRRYREAVFEDSRRLRRASVALRLRAGLTRARLVALDGGHGLRVAPHPGRSAGA